jgi:hypothetical protein
VHIFCSAEQHNVHIFCSAEQHNVHIFCTRFYWTLSRNVEVNCLRDWFTFFSRAWLPTVLNFMKIWHSLVSTIRSQTDVVLMYVFFFSFVKIA